MRYFVPLSSLVFSSPRTLVVRLGVNSRVQLKSPTLVSGGWSQLVRVERAPLKGLLVGAVPSAEPCDPAHARRPRSGGPAAAAEELPGGRRIR